MSQCERILAVLADGKPHTMQEVHERVGFCRLNSRVSELRERGHEITCDKAGGIYTYRLAVRDADEAERLGPDGSPHHGSPPLDGPFSPDEAGSGALPSRPTQQLTVWEAA